MNARYRVRPEFGPGTSCRLLWVVAWLLCGGSGRAVESSWVWRGDDGLLDYQVEADGDRIPDFSMVGFEAGWSDLPATPPVMITVAAATGDSTARIQAAIDQAARLPLQPSGFRGAVQLAPGDFEIAGQLRIATSGVVLRGSGTTGSSLSRLIATGTSTRDLIAIGDATARQSYQGSTIGIAADRVPVGATSFAVTSTTGLTVGQAINVNWTSNQAWIDANGMDKLANPWLPGQRQQNSDRIITRIEGNRVVLDAPITTAIDKLYGGGNRSPAPAGKPRAASLHPRGAACGDRDHRHADRRPPAGRAGRGLRRRWARPWGPELRPTAAPAIRAQSSTR